MSDTYTDLSSRLEETFLDIEKALTGSGEVHLTAEEHEPLVEYLHLLFKREDMERRHIYFRGHTDAFAYLKKIHAI